MIMQNFEVVTDKFNIVRISTSISSSQKAEMLDDDDDDDDDDVCNIQL